MRAREGIGRDAALALLLAALLTACWAWMQRGDLAVLNLPDSDDNMRLAQIRDWLAGQAFSDWTQYRVAPPDGVAMHWSRINDFVPAALIALAAPLVGQHAAELIAVILYPGLLFALALFLSARIARAIGLPQSAAVAILLALLAYPAMSLFRPGRIDHHALQIVLVQAGVLAAVVPPSLRSGLALGASIAIGFGIGLEAAAQSLALIGAIGIAWIAGRDGERQRLAGAGWGLVLPTLFMLAFMRPASWSAAYCDSFTPASASAAIAAGAGLLLLGAASRRLSHWRARLIAAALLGGLIAVALLLAFPNCVSGPYGAMPPFLQYAIIDHVTEAQGPFDAPSLAEALPPVGMTFAGAVAGLWLLWRRPARRLDLLAPAAVVGVSALIALSQVRGAYIGSAAAAPLLAQLIVAARRLRAPVRLPALLGAWLASAGIAWMILPALAADDEGGPPAAAASTGDCRSGDVWRRLDALPAGTIMASIDHGARILSGSRHRVVAASYHRANVGNLAMYRFFLGDPARARDIARQWQVDYVAICATDFAELDAARKWPASLAVALQSGRTPAWLARIPLQDNGLALYRVR